MDAVRSDASYLEIAATLGDELVTATTGARVPGVHALMATHGVSRPNARAAPQEREQRYLVPGSEAQAPSSTDASTTSSVHTCRRVARRRSPAAVSRPGSGSSASPSHRRTATWRTGKASATAAQW